MEELILEHSDMPLDELQHWGIKGMKWGRRRYQNKDGSLTPEGEKRYNQQMEKIEAKKAKLAEKQRIQQNKQETQAKFDRLKAEKAELKAQKKALKDDGKDKDTGETDEQKRERLLKSVDAKELYENKHLLSYQELNERINRIDTEAKLKSRIVEEKAKTGKEYMKDATDGIRKATDLYKSIDDAVTTVTKSNIGKFVAKNVLGIEPPKKEFNINELWKKRNKLSDKEIQDISQRLSNEKKIQDELNRRAKQAQKEADDAAKKLASEKSKAEAAEKAAAKKAKIDEMNAKAAAAKAEAQKQVDDYVNSGYKNDRVGPKEYNTSSTPMKGKDVVDNVYNSKTLLLTGPTQSTELSIYKQVGEKYVQELYGKNGEFITYIDPLRHSDELQHWGIKGMKWGVRRYQNKDGSLTPEGKKRIEENAGSYMNPSKNDKNTKNRKAVSDVYNRTFANVMKYNGIDPETMDGAEINRKLEEKGKAYVVDNLWNNFIDSYSTATLKDLKITDTPDSRAYVKSLFEKERAPINTTKVEKINKDKRQEEKARNNRRDEISAEAVSKLDKMIKQNVDKEKQKEAITEYYKQKTAELDAQGESILADHIWYGDYLNLMDKIDRS